jgi:hypothetical protein
MRGLTGFIAIVLCIALTAKIIISCKKEPEMQCNEIPDSTMIKNLSENLVFKKKIIIFVV